ncbi:cation diffusion facilitator family transporter [Coxiella-like endosymbiont of Amblyomma americanum]|uniref:cation diffusion facilitator family transporter n=1 Tax=Coxiella-like endosymbiont of Amblyomma americanum TaxID=1987500 RepID=UPI000F89EA13|nr:cation diffusion facilitator family transporter [Coxiella-like endosymbiont of Amblyomma americanum]AUJ58817.1 cation transporter [Coxiella-like endosymbiont of Amblyomma americanum]
MYKTRQNKSNYYFHNNTTTPYWTLILVTFFIIGFSIIEVVSGYTAHSLTLLGEASHTIFDAVSLGITILASWINLRPPSPRHSYGFGRLEVIAAWISSLLMFIISLIIIVQAIKRFHYHSLSSVQGFPVMVISTVSILLNLLIFQILLSSNIKSLNIRATLLHVISDLSGAVITFISGITIFFTHWTPIDPLLSICVSTLIMISSIRLLQKSMTILMESVPCHLSVYKVSQTISRFKGVSSVHDIHIWTLSSVTTALSAHINIKNLTAWDDLLIGLKAILQKKYRINHITLQPEIDTEDCNSCYKL